MTILVKLGKANNKYTYFDRWFSLSNIGLRCIIIFNITIDVKYVTGNKLD